MSVADWEADIGAAVFAGLGRAVTYRDNRMVKTSTTAVIDHYSDADGFESQRVEKRTAIDLLVADVGQPERGCTVIVSDTEAYTLHDMEGHDGVVVRFSAKPANE